MSRDMVCLSRTHFFIKTYFHKNNEAAIGKKKSKLTPFWGLEVQKQKKKNNIIINFYESESISRDSIS